MQHDIPKMCVDSLRTFVNEKHNIKLKAAHAHELFSAFVGYPSRNAMLADTTYPINNLPQAKIVVLVSDDEIDRRRGELQELSSDLPNSGALVEQICTSLFSDKFSTSQLKPFRSFKNAAVQLAEADYNFQSVFRFYSGIPLLHSVSVIQGKDKITLSIEHAYRTFEAELLGCGKTTIQLRRVAGRIGFAEPIIEVEIWSGEMRKILLSSDWKNSLA